MGIIKRNQNKTWLEVQVCLIKVIIMVMDMVRRKRSFIILKLVVTLKKMILITHIMKIGQRA